MPHPAGFRRLALVFGATIPLAAGAVAIPAEAAGVTLLVSGAPDRSAASALDGSAGNPKPYIFASVPYAARRVAFFLDGASTPTKVDYTAPFDLGGTRWDGSARPVGLAPGSHTLRAKVWRGTSPEAAVTAHFTVPADATGFTARSGRPFSATSAWNRPIPANAALDPDSAILASTLSAGGAAQSALLEETGVPVFDADAATMRYQVSCSEDWGTCPLERVSVPIPTNAAPSNSSDGAMVVIDWSTRTSYEFWRARRTATGWETSWGSVNPVDGDGYDPRADSPTGAGISRLAGVVRTFEIEQGRIDHALVFASSISARGTFRYPAAKTDGINMRGVAVPLPEGARIQLDPRINVDAIVGITPGEKIVAKALQTYGAYNIDNGGYNTMGFNFETPSGEANPYPAAGFAWDYAGMPHIPWSQLRVLRSWDGS